MLVLSRKVGDSIVIDGNVEVTVTRIGHGRVTIGVSAPDHVRIRRQELTEWGELEDHADPDQSDRNATYTCCDLGALVAN